MSEDLWTVPSLHPGRMAEWAGWVRDVFLVGFAAECVVVPLGCCNQVPTHPAPRLSVLALPGGKFVLFLGQRGESRGWGRGRGDHALLPPTSPGQKEGLRSLGSRDQEKLLIS